MTVHYFEINNCSLLYYCGYPILLAPAGTDEGLLTKRGFARQNDGNWIRYIDQFEYGYIMQFGDRNEVVINDETARQIVYPPIQYIQQPNFYNAPPPLESTPNILCIVSISLMALSLPATFIGTIILGGLFYIAALVLMMVARIKYPQSQFARVLCIVYIILTVILVILTAIAIVLLIIACNECLDSMRSCS